MPPTTNKATAYARPDRRKPTAPRPPYAAAPHTADDSAEVAAAPPGDVVEPTADGPVSIADVVIAFALVFGIAFVAPFLAGFENIMGLLIIGFGVYQAWKMNKRADVEITGPHAVRPQPTESP